MILSRICFFVTVIAAISFSQTPIAGNYYVYDVSPNGQFILLGNNTLDEAPPNADTLMLYHVSNKNISTILTYKQFSSSGKFISVHFMGNLDSIVITYGSDASFQTYLFNISSFMTSAVYKPKALNNYLTKVYPLPSTGSTLINFEIPASKQVRIEIANLKGCIVRVLSADNASENKIVWDGKNQYGDAVPSGQYVAKIIYGKTVESKMVCITE